MKVQVKLERSQPVRVSESTGAPHAPLPPRVVGGMFIQAVADLTQSAAAIPCECKTELDQWFGMVRRSECPSGKN